MNKSNSLNLIYKINKYLLYKSKACISHKLCARSSKKQSLFIMPLFPQKKLVTGKGLWHSISLYF